MRRGKCEPPGVVGGGLGMLGAHGLKKGGARAKMQPWMNTTLPNKCPIEGLLSFSFFISAT